MSKDREIQYLHMRCNNLNDRLYLAIHTINELVSVQTQKLNPYHPEGEYYQSLSTNCMNALNDINNQWALVEDKYKDVIEQNKLDAWEQTQL